MPKLLPTKAPVSAADAVRRLAAQLELHTDFAGVLSALTAGGSGSLAGIWGSARALAAAALERRCPGTLTIVLPHARDVDGCRDDLALFSAAESASFPAWESQLGQRVAHDEIFAARLRVLKRLAGPQPLPAVVTSIQALMHPVPSRVELAAATRRLRTGAALDLEEFVRWLVQQGLHSTTAVELPGEFSARGGILDVFAPDAEAPLRVELFGDAIESLRIFEPGSQRSQRNVDAAEVTALEPNQPRRAHWAEHLPEGSWLMLCEPADLQEEGRFFHQRQQRAEECFSVTTTLAELLRRPHASCTNMPVGSESTTAELRLESVEQFSGDVGRVRDQLDAVIDQEHVLLVCDTAAEMERLGEVFGESRLATSGRLQLLAGRLQGGFRWSEQGVVLISAAELFHRQELSRPAVRQTGRAIDSFLELREGDLVVHLAHGIGRYRGIQLLSKEGAAEEHLVLEFHEGTRIFVPSSKIELVQKYVGGRKAKPALARIGGKSWQRQKQAAEAAVTDVAVDMLQLQAARAARPGIAFPDDSAWQREFDAAFPYLETDDQLAAIRAIKDDMRQPKPMDRLLCGDVGFGKTEVAMRATFKAIDAGYQVALLAPTTVLAEQHRRTFVQRMAEFPFEIACLSRFCTAREQREIVERAAAGKLDLLIGTHRLASPDVQFANLGLVIIDEEQRFGVAVKERLKALRASVDVLTMTATPIPRTLHLSLLGVRSISNLETAPRDRLAVETRISRFDPALVRQAVLRELNREGQVYFVHNRVHDIDRIAAQLREIVPEARIGIGHGQMPEHELEDVMCEFVDRKFDLLLATTIVESGLDIPNANTIFIDQCDRYGLADLHQLRGRVGRYKHRAYCYLLIDADRRLTPEAARRLRAIEEFSEMGAGFSLAMRDLELRGAGNLLGSQQSGHIATVGYELYCSLLEKTIRRLRQLPPTRRAEASIDLPAAAYFPPAYVADLRAKIDLYRRFARLTEEPPLDELAAELVDRFGPLPAPVQNLVDLARLRIWASALGVAALRLEDRFLVWTVEGRGALHRLQQKFGGTLRLVDAVTGYLPAPGLVAEGRAVDPPRLLDRVKALLRPSEAGP